MGAYEKVLLVTRPTRLEGLVKRYNTKRQAKFYIEHQGGDFQGYQAEDDEYRRSLDQVRASLDLGLKVQQVGRELLPNLVVSDSDLVVALGQDGLVANTAKYVGSQPLVGVNPDPARFDGVLLPFAADQARAAVTAVLEDRARVREVSMAQAQLDDGQRLLAFNDLYLGAASHVSSRYRVTWRGQTESQSSSGILVSTGAGSTGWLSSVFHMASAVTRLGGGEPGERPTMGWEDRRLMWITREPFQSRHSSIQLSAGVLEEGEALEVESRMPAGGVVFSDGVEADRLQFVSGRVASIGLAPERARLVVGALA